VFKRDFFSSQCLFPTLIRWLWFGVYLLSYKKRSYLVLFCCSFTLISIILSPCSTLFVYELFPSFAFGSFIYIYNGLDDDFTQHCLRWNVLCCWKFGLFHIDTREVEATNEKPGSSPELQIFCFSLAKLRACFMSWLL